MEYDDAHRLVSTVVTGTGRTVFGETLAWDSRSLRTRLSRTDRNGASLEFTHDPAGRLTEVLRTGGGASFDLPDGWSFDFDEAENLLARETRRSTEVQWDQMQVLKRCRPRRGGGTLESTS